jgi:acyl-coenzyme A thioesterase PaaI-like protein
VATVNPGTGVVTAVTAGTTVITAIVSNPDLTVVTGVSIVTVTATGGSGGTIASITVIPGSQAVQSPNATAQYIAIGTTTTGATVYLTHQVAWSSSSADIGTISTSGNSTGLATAVGQGTATLTALYTPPANGNTVTGTATFTVVGGTSEQFTALTLTPGSESLSASGQTSQFVALAKVGTNGFQQDVTNSPQIKWSSSIPTIASVSSSGLATGLRSR